MTLRRRSWVIGRGVATFSICRAMALASNSPTQIGSTFSPSLSRRITIGMLVSGSTINPLIVISICMMSYNLGAEPGAVNRFERPAPDAVRAAAFDTDSKEPANPFGRPWQIDDHIL